MIKTKRRRCQVRCEPRDAREAVRGSRPHPPAATPSLGNTYERRLFPQVDVDGVDEYSARCFDLWDTYYIGLSFTLTAEGDREVSSLGNVDSLVISPCSMSVPKETNKISGQGK